MLIKGFILLLIIQMIVFLVEYRVFILNRKLKEFVGKVYVYDSFIMIFYLILCIVKIIFADKGFYSPLSIKLVYCLIFLTVIPSNLFKIISHYRVKYRNKKYDKLRENIDFFAILGIVVVIVMSFMFEVPCSTNEVKLIERIEFNKVEVEIKNKEHSKDKFYYLNLYDESNNKHIVEKDEMLKNITCHYSEDKFIEKYEEKEILENAFGYKKINVYHNYIVTTPNITESFLIENFLKNTE